MVLNRTIRFPSQFESIINCCRRGHSWPLRLRLKRQHKRKKVQPTNEPYIFHPLVRTIEPVSQALRLTKTIIKEGLPPLVASTAEDLPFDEIMVQIKRSVVPGVSLDVEKYKNGEHSKRLMANVVKAVWSTAESYPGLLQQAISYRPALKVHWRRFGHNLQVSGRTGVLFSSLQPLQPNFSSMLEVNETEAIPLHNKEEIISPVFELSQNSSRPVFESGFFGNVFPFPRTLIITEHNWKLSHLTAQGIMFSFGRLVERAINWNKANLGETLECPLSMRSLVYNDSKMALLCYQLNTLNFENDEGIKNQLWLIPEIAIPTARINKANELRVSKFHEDQFRVLIAMFLYGENDDNTSKVASRM